MISRAANRTSSERPSATSLRPSISALSFSRVRSDAGILSIGVLLRRGRSPNRTSLVSPIRRGCTPTLFPASLGLHQRILGHGECAALDVFRAYSHEPYVAVNGYILRRAPEEERARLIGRVPDKHERGQHALSVMEQHLRANDWFVLTATRSPI